MSLAKYIRDGRGVVEREIFAEREREWGIIEILRASWRAVS